MLDRNFWRGFLDIEHVVAIKVAPFDRYRTLDVVAAVIESGRRDVALYTGNDDSIVTDLLTPSRRRRSPAGPFRRRPARPVGRVDQLRGRAAGRLPRCPRPRRRRASGEVLRFWRRAVLTDANAAFFDAAHQFAGCIPGIHEVLRRQGLLAGRWCLDPHEELSPGQMAEIDRVLTTYPNLSDDGFVQEHLDRWLA